MRTTKLKLALMRRPWYLSCWPRRRILRTLATVPAPLRVFLRCGNKLPRKSQSPAPPQRTDSIRLNFHWKTVKLWLINPGFNFTRPLAKRRDGWRLKKSLKKLVLLMSRHPRKLVSPKKSVLRKKKPQLRLLPPRKPDSKQRKKSGLFLSKRNVLLQREQLKKHALQQRN